MQNFSTIDLSNEKKLIFAGPYLHKLKGIIITQENPEKSHYPICNTGDTVFRTMPIVGEDWQVIDDSWASLETEYGFEQHILGREGETTPLCNQALIYALSEITDEQAYTPANILSDCEHHGIHLSDAGCCKQITLTVNKGYKEGSYEIGNVDDILDLIDRHLPAPYYPVATHMFKLDIDKPERVGELCYLDSDMLLFKLKRAVGAYAYFFQRTGIRVKLNFNADVPAKARKKIRKLIAQVNAYMEFLDDINTFEPKKQSQHE